MTDEKGNSGRGKPVIELMPIPSKEDYDDIGWFCAFIKDTPVNVSGEMLKFVRKIRKLLAERDLAIAWVNHYECSHAADQLCFCDPEDRPKDFDFGEGGTS